MPRIVYEITATVDLELCEDYERYMVGQHIPDLMETGSFGRARFDRAKPGSYRIRYESADRSALELYLNDHAPRLRQHLKETFPKGVELTREFWEEIAVW